MQYGVEVLPQDVPLLDQSVGAVGQSPMRGRNGDPYYEMGTDDRAVWDGWRTALDRARRPYKYVDGINQQAVPVNAPNW
ncbi:hypothetical protein A8H39_01995 [Paraburkholderia fungorum]|nr:hypothetical protein [Paraburkholderia fungorum]PNE59943.1 hypothetical protein A8H39_01995 [Paraburkholderia fungorum]